MCKHIAVETLYIYELWALHRLQKAKVTFKLTEGHWQSCQSIGHNDFYRATAMLSVVYAVVVCLCVCVSLCVCVCVCVCVSVTLQY